MEMSRPHHFFTFSTGRGYYRYTGVDWTLAQLDIESAGFIDVFS